jgi:AraC-like DNA-binding protein
MMPVSGLDAARESLARFNAYEEYVSPLQKVERPDNLAHFDWSANLTLLGGAVFSRTRVSRHVSLRTPAYCAQLGLDHIVAYYRLSGLGHLKAGADPVTLRSGDITFMDLSRPMWTEGEIDAICIGFPRGTFTPLVRDVDAMHGLALRGDTVLGRLAMAHLDALAGEIHNLRESDGGAVADATAALLAICVSGCPTHPAPAKARARPALLLTMRHHIEQHLSDPTLSAASIARHFAVSRSTLYRLFEPFGGIDAYIRRRRLSRAYQTLKKSSGRSGDYIYQVSQAWGFASETAFSHAFRREFQATPREVANGQVAPLRRTPSVPRFAELTACLRDMALHAP